MPMPYILGDHCDEPVFASENTYMQFYVNM